jgi:hypothetical protein
MTDIDRYRLQSSSIYPAVIGQEDDF